MLPPLNTSPDVDVTLSMLSQATYPPAESGYYVVPVTLANETFRQNGLTTPDDIHQQPIDKLRKIFGADGELIDLRNGRSLWKDHATASSVGQSAVNT